MVTVYLGLGSNIGDSRQYIEHAIRLMGSSLSGVKRAPFYLSKAVGYTDQPDFMNTVVSGQTKLEPEALLAHLKYIEQQVGRTASFRWGPRQIDIDIIFYGDQTLKTDKLTLPHPRFRERDFVLRPLNDLNPRLTDPVSGQTVAQLLERLSPGQHSLIRQVDENS